MEPLLSVIEIIAPNLHKCACTKGKKIFEVMVSFELKHNMDLLILTTSLVYRLLQV